MTSMDNTLPSHTILLGVTNSPSLSNFQDFRLFLDDCLQNPHTDNTVRDYSMEFTTFHKNLMKDHYQ